MAWVGAGPAIAGAVLLAGAAMVLGTMVALQTGRTDYEMSHERASKRSSTLFWLSYRRPHAS